MPSAQGRYLFVFTCVLAATLAAGCKTTAPVSSVRDDAGINQSGDGSSNGPKLCAAMRGNGNLIYSHFAGLSRILETYGMVDGMAGGSSGSVSTFLYESIYANPLIRDCENGACSEADTAARASLLLKSLQAYLGYITNTEEAIAIKQLVPIAAKVRAAGIDSLEEAETVAARDAMLTIFNSPDMRDVINPELLHMLSTSADPEYAAREAYLAVNAVGEWSVADPKIFFRPGIINFPAIAKKLGRIGSFLAAYEPVNRSTMKLFLDSCAVPGRGKQWSEIHEMSAQGITCGQLFLGTLDDFRTKLLANEAQYPSRINDPIGKFIPSLIMTSVLTGDAVEKFKVARANYIANKPLDFSMSFDDLKIGYWGRAEDLQTVGRNDQNYADLKSRKFLPLGEAKWLEALSYSPAEPSLARALEMKNDLISAGGWPDLHPVLVLKNLGCDNVVYLTRRGDESDFAMGVGRHLGMTDAEQKGIYDLDNPASGYSQSISEAGGVLCTNWNVYDTMQVAELSDHVFNAPIEARSPFFQNAEYENVRSNVNLRGCTPGASVETFQ